jgi:regulatory protein
MATSPLPKKKLTSALFSLLAKRDYTKKMLYAKLISLGYEENAIELALNEAERQGFIHEQRFIENYIHQQSQRGYGPIRIQIALEAKGLESGAILAAMPDKSFWIDLANVVRQKRFGAAKPAAYAEKAKQMRFLQYRGFDVECVKLEIVA